MAYDKVVDSAQLDADLKVVADAIRSKGGTSEPLSFPQGMASAVEAIQSGGGSGEDYLEKRLIGEPYDYYNDKITVLYQYAFYEDRSVQNINLPNVESVGLNSFGTRTVKTIKLPSLLEIREVRSCRSLTLVDFTKATTVESFAFHEDYVLKSVLIRNTNIATLEKVDAFTNCHHFHGTINATYNPDGLKDGYIYVPRALIEDYKVATNWSTFAEQFRVLEDYTVDGTITGELDESKI